MFSVRSVRHSVHGEGGCDHYLFKWTLHTPLTSCHDRYLSWSTCTSSSLWMYILHHNCGYMTSLHNWDRIKQSSVTVHQWSCGKVMFSVISVCSWGDPHMTITQDALDLTVQPSQRHQIRDHLALRPGLTSPWTSDPQPHPLVVTSGFQDYTTAQTSSLEDTSPTTNTDIWRLLKHVQLASGRYAFYWNTFLFILAIAKHIKV